MDLDSWTPVDTARRLSILLAVGAAVFTFLALWLGAGAHPLLALLGGAGLGALLRGGLFGVLRRVLGRPG